jgi:hypothetical protein
MLNKIKSALSRNRKNDPYAYLPEPMRAEVYAAMEATSMYDIR